MRYLHNHMIIYRDLNPENVALDVRGDMRLFDFGLAKELKRKDLVEPPDGFQATGLTGSRRYSKCQERQEIAGVDALSVIFLFILVVFSLVPKWHRRLWLVRIIIMVSTRMCTRLPLSFGKSFRVKKPTLECRLTITLIK